jgi:hypothetical protein
MNHVWEDTVSNIYDEQICTRGNINRVQILLPTNAILFNIWNIKIYIKTLFTVTPTCFGPCGPSSESLYWAWLRLQFAEWDLSLTLQASQHTHYNLKHMLPQNCINYNDVFSRIVTTKKQL